MHLRAIIFVNRRCDNIHEVDKDAGGIIGGIIRKLCFRLRFVIPITIPRSIKTKFSEPL